MAQSPADTDLPIDTDLGRANRARKIVEALTDVPERCIQFVDDNVAANLPLGSQIKGMFPHGAAYWTRTATIKIEQADGTPLAFFLKVTHTDEGGTILRGEFASMTALHNTAPEFCGIPIAVGDYASDPDVHFFLCSFVDMTDEVAELGALPSKLAEVHMKGTCPNGKYGFPVPTGQGALVQPNTWTISWEKCFSDMMVRLFAWEEEMHGLDVELRQLANAVIDKAIPRLLRPLETGGREIEPRIVHGDLWDGNTSSDAVTGRPVIFDASSLYAHNEYELGAWSLPRHQIYKPYVRAYQKCFPISAPVEDVDDRLLLYRLRFNLTSSGCYLNNLRFRELAREDMRYLVGKYPNGYEGYDCQKGVGMSGA